MSIAEIVICTDWGDVKLTGDRRHLVERAKKRRDGQPDLRYADGKLAQFVIDAVRARGAEYCGNA